MLKKTHLRGATAYFLSKGAFAYFSKKNMQLHLVGAICEVHLHCTEVGNINKWGTLELEGEKSGEHKSKSGERRINTLLNKPN